MMRPAHLMLAALLLPALAFAQIEVGDKAPKIEVEEFLNAKAKSMKDFDGQLILLEYFAYW